ncbi:hypothetical protein TNCV_4720431 [Trichonephila clavipes]|uniref:Uncharacterized protein n=1 Tax=Trichonephila clavipes TaxID=2585209 RepID=A0A8X6W5Y4_TRICX|nr:hypothetical protein TNCV_4720431 [Trichonephila clavipes]
MEPFLCLVHSHQHVGNCLRLRKDFRKAIISTFRERLLKRMRSSPRSRMGFEKARRLVIKFRIDLSQVGILFVNPVGDYFGDLVTIFETKDGQDKSCWKNSSGRSPLTDERIALKLQYDWSRPINAESGRGNRLGRSGNKRPGTRRS